MDKVRFKSKVTDRDTQFEYPISNEFVEVSDAFAKRLKEVDPKGNAYEFEGVDYKQSESVKDIVPANDSELQSKIDELIEQKHELSAEKLTVENELIVANQSIEELKFQLEVKEEELKQAEQVIAESQKELVAEKKADLFDDKPKKETK